MERGDGPQPNEATLKARRREAEIGGRVETAQVELARLAELAARLEEQDRAQADAPGNARPGTLPLRDRLATANTANIDPRAVMHDTAEVVHGEEVAEEEREPHTLAVPDTVDAPRDPEPASVVEVSTGGQVESSDDLAEAIAERDRITAQLREAMSEWTVAMGAVDEARRREEAQRARAVATSATASAPDVPSDPSGATQQSPRPAQPQPAPGGQVPGDASEPAGAQQPQPGVSPGITQPPPVRQNPTSRPAPGRPEPDPNLRLAVHTPEPANPPRPAVAGSLTESLRRQVNERFESRIRERPELGREDPRRNELGDGGRRGTLENPRTEHERSLPETVNTFLNTFRLKDRPIAQRDLQRLKRFAQRALTAGGVTALGSAIDAEIGNRYGKELKPQLIRAVHESIEAQGGVDAERVAEEARLTQAGRAFAKEYWGTLPSWAQRLAFASTKPFDAYTQADLRAHNTSREAVLADIYGAFATKNPNAVPNIIVNNADGNTTSLRDLIRTSLAEQGFYHRASVADPAAPEPPAPTDPEPEPQPQDAPETEPETQVQPDLDSIFQQPDTTYPMERFKERLRTILERARGEYDVDDIFAYIEAHKDALLGDDERAERGALRGLAEKLKGPEEDARPNFILADTIHKALLRESLGFESTQLRETMVAQERQVREAMDQFTRRGQERANVVRAPIVTPAHSTPEQKGGLMQVGAQVASGAGWGALAGFAVGGAYAAGTLATGGGLTVTVAVAGLVVGALSGAVGSYMSSNRSNTQ